MDRHRLRRRVHVVLLADDVQQPAAACSDRIGANGGELLERVRVRPWPGRTDQQCLTRHTRGGVARKPQLELPGEVKAHEDGALREADDRVERAAIELGVEQLEGALDAVEQIGLIGARARWQLPPREAVALGPGRIDSDEVNIEAFGFEPVEQRRQAMAKARAAHALAVERQDPHGRGAVRGQSEQKARAEADERVYGCESGSAQLLKHPPPLWITSS
jgi:hypothetical protein